MQCHLGSAFYASFNNRKRLTSTNKLRQTDTKQSTINRKIKRYS